MYDAPYLLHDFPGLDKASAEMQTWTKLISLAHIHSRSRRRMSDVEVIALRLNRRSMALLAIKRSRRKTVSIALMALLICGATNKVSSQVADTLPSIDKNITELGREKASQRNAPELKPGQVVERELKGGESHLYTVALKTGEYMKVSVMEKAAIYLEVRVLDPGGKAIAQVNLERAGTEDSIWMVAKATGGYQVQLTAPETKGLTGKYVINLERVGELKTAESSDQAYVKAHELFWEAHILYDQRGDQALRQAVEKYEEALTLWRSLKDRIREAQTLNSLGGIHAELGEPEKAIESFEQALPIWQEVKNRQREADTLHDIALIKMGQNQNRTVEALDSLRQELNLWRILGDKARQAVALSNMGAVYYGQADLQKMLECYEEAQPLAHASGDLRVEARVLSNLSAVYFSRGEFQKAFDYSKQALPLRRAAGDQRGEAATLANIGSIYRELGELQKALEYYQQALSSMRTVVGNQSGEAPILEALGHCYYDLGDYPKALEYHTQSLSLRQKQNNRGGEGSSFANIGKVYARMGERQKALEYFKQSLELRRVGGDRRGETQTLQNMGELYAESGDLKKAQEYFNDALALSRAIKSRSYEANLLYDIARIDMRAGHSVEARSQIEAAIAIIESTRSGVASRDLRASFLASKQDFYELDIDLLMQSYLREQNRESLIKAFAVSEQRRARTLLESLEEARAKIRQGVSPELLVHERALRATLDQKAESQIKLLSGKHTAEQEAALSKEIETLNTEYEQVLADIRVSGPRYAALTQSGPLSLNELQTEILEPDTLLLEYSLGKEKSYLWAVTSTDIAGYELPGRDEIEGQVRDVYALLTSRSQFVKFEKPDERQARIARSDTAYYQAADRLSELLLGSIAAKMKGKSLLIVSDGALQYLPFAALPTPVANEAEQNKQMTQRSYRPLVASYEITSLPSASILAALRREAKGRNPAPKTVAILADPVFRKTDERVVGAKSRNKPGQQAVRSIRSSTSVEDSDSELVRGLRDVIGQNELDIERLPATRQEAEAIVRFIPSRDRFKALDFDANRNVATSPELSHYRIVHFATHGLIDTSHPALSGLLFSLVDRQGNDQNGFLPTPEIFNLKLPAGLVVLSGCRTGLGKDIRGEGILGLTRGFMYAGAARVAVSLWDVNDKSTAELMGQFYRGMLGNKNLSPSAALREAQVSMWRSPDWHAPYYWAAFVIQGEYR